ncbi:MAG: hypothetical protein MI802_13130 [Desulfobacterales bacterium]|nr:hypothetical protein [Desulfobacterales bacterium]
MKEFIKFVLPSVMSLITISLYMMVDAVFVSRYAGPMALAAVNIVMPLFNLSIGLAIMTAAGSSAIIGIELGQKRYDAANRHFSLTFCFLLGLMAAFYIGVRAGGIEQIARLLGASDILAPFCTAYLEMFLPGITAVLLQLFFEYFIRLDGRPGYAFLITLASGLTNVALDYWLIVHMDMGIRGAGIASTAGILVAVAMGIIYFLFRADNLKPARPAADIGFLCKSLVNGSSEMVTELSSGVKILVFNLIIIQYAGEAGVAAMAIFLNLYFVMSSFHVGLIMGTAPVFSYNFGAGNFPKVRQLVGQALTASAVAAAVVFILAQTQASSIIGWFTRDARVFSIAAEGFRIFSFTFLFNGFTILASGFFTAVGNGKISASIAAMNSIVFTLGFVAVLPGFMGLKGVWTSVPLAEFTAMIMSAVFFMKFRGVYVTPDLGNNAALNQC